MNVLDGILGRPDLSIPPIRNCLNSVFIKVIDAFESSTSLGWINIVMCWIIEANW